MTAWVVGASGAWGRAVSLELLRRGHDVLALGRRPVPELAAWAERLGRTWRDQPFDLGRPDTAALEQLLAAEPPDALFLCAAAHEGPRDALLEANYLAPAALIEAAVPAMQARGGGRIGVFVGQNARLGLPGAGDFSAGQAALWTWCESLQAALAAAGSPVTLTRVIPPRTASPTQAFLAQRTGRSARLHRPDAGRLVRDVLAGRRHAGRRPLAAALAMLLR